MSFNQPICISGVCYFASDFHFGAPNMEESKKRETLVINWLDNIKKDANHLFLLGDIFDFWFEYNKKPPVFYAVFLEKLAELRKTGVEIYFFTGNHDMWVKNYLSDYLGIHIFKKNQEFMINNHKFLLGHGDGLGSGDWGYKCLKAFLNCKLNKWLFGLIPQKTGFALAHFFSKKSRAMSPKQNNVSLENDNKTLQFCQKYLLHNHIDYFIFGHIHFPLEMVCKNAIYYNTGDWLNHNTYIRYEKTPVLIHFG
jgi:UDP-2,3-diacylglucosamine hydrolase